MLLCHLVLATCFWALIIFSTTLQSYLIQVLGLQFCIQVKRRKEGEGEPSKFMGCGVCDNFSRSETVNFWNGRL